MHDYYIIIDEDHIDCPVKKTPQNDNTVVFPRIIVAYWMLTVVQPYLNGAC